MVPYLWAEVLSFTLKFVLNDEILKVEFFLAYDDSEFETGKFHS